MNAADVELLENYWIQKSRVNFYAYRNYMRANNFTSGWFVTELCKTLQAFYVDLIKNKKPILVIQTPPQHGKSWAVMDFLSWLIGREPTLRIIFASFSDRLGHRCNASIKRHMDSDKFQRIFPEAQISEYGSKSYSRNNSFIEILTDNQPTDGYFRNTTVGGPITGETLDLGVIDDPIKGREQANSKVFLEKIWDWFSNDFSTRFAENAGLLIVTTRWSVGDLVGKLKEKKAGLVKVVNFPAIAPEDEDHRAEGEPLFPELKSLDFLLDKKSILSPSHWNALYQGNPTIEGGNLFKLSYWNFYSVLPKIQYRVIYGDTAQKDKEQNDWSVFQCWGKSYEGKIYMLDQIRGKWEAPDLERMAISFYNKHKSVQGLGVLRQMKVEDKSSGTGLIQYIKRKGIPVKGIPRNTDKVSRANDVVPMIDVGNVWLPQESTWLNDYLNEADAFPNGDHDDQVDPTMDAIEDMLINPTVINYKDIL